MHLLAVCLIAVCVAPRFVHLSAIPMWEYLSKDEKMSYLYSMFANQVEEFCEFSEMQNCNRELLKFGLGKLKDMPEDHLDTMDPYQRGANTLIWDSMMEGHEMMRKKASNSNSNVRSRTTTPEPNAYDHDAHTADIQSEASAKIETYAWRVPPPAHFKIANGPSQYYARPTTAYYTATSSTTRSPYPYANRNHYQHVQRPKEAAVSEHPLTGPMVVRVRLDGTPVDTAHELPQDEDLKQYRMSQAKIPFNTY